MVYVKWTIQCLSLGACVRAQLLHSCPTLSHPMDCSPPGSSVHGILQQEYWGGSPCPPPGDLTDPGIKPASPASPASAGGFFTAEPPGKPLSHSRGANHRPHHHHSFKAQQHTLLHHWNQKTGFSAAINSLYDSGQVS